MPRNAAFTRIVGLGWLMAILLAQAILAAASAAAAEHHQVIVLETLAIPAVQDRTAALRRRLEQLGQAAGDSIDITVISAEGQQALGEQRLREAITAARPDLVISIATVASKAAHAVLKETDIPLLFFFVSDPVGAGLVQRLDAASGTNVVGQVDIVDRTVQLEILMRLLAPEAPDRPLRIGLVGTTYPAALGDVRHLQEIAAGRADVTFHPFLVEHRPTDQFPAMIADTLAEVGRHADTVDVLWLAQGVAPRDPRYVAALLERSPLPVVMAVSPDAVKAGVLMAITSDPETEGEEAAHLAWALLQGASPGHMPIHQPSRFTLSINLSTATRMGLVIPGDVLELAGPNVYR